MYSYSTDWAIGGPIIERDEINLLSDCGIWTADMCPEKGGNHVEVSGPTPLIAAMRVYVASVLGDEVDVPDELCEGEQA